MITSTPVRRVMNEKLEKIIVNRTAQEAAHKMGAVNTSSLIVTDLTDKPIGIITERDLVRRVVANDANSKTVLIKDIMASPIVTIDANSSVEAAADLMLQNKVRHLLVVEHEDVNMPLGIITSTDFASYLMEGK
ncbi:MAG TPA: CBS domain-containing protein [Candidatus Nitrosopolaris rasttigaisensis]|nr:CBS domain-containing protein [Candidatus Nitrosopolaris rasttigaisensis]